MSPGDHLNVITTLPNRYASFDVGAATHEYDGNVSIERISIPIHHNGMLDQSRAFIAYARQVLKQTKDKKYDLIVATSSRLMTASLAAYIARSRKIPLYLDIRDIFVDTIKDVLPRGLSWFFKPVFDLLERWTIHTASRVNLVSRGFEGYFKSKYPDSVFSYFTNGVDESFVNTPPQDFHSEKNDTLHVVYAGNIGEGQGLHKFLPEFASALKGRVRFSVYGSGGRRAALEAILDSGGVDNVEVHNPISRPELIKVYQQADVLLIHLNNYDAFLKVLPSKLFEYAATGKPILAGVSGYSAGFIRSNISNSAIFEPCDVKSAIIALSELKIEMVCRDDVVREYSRKLIMQRMASDIVSLVD